MTKGGDLGASENVIVFPITGDGGGGGDNKKSLIQTRIKVGSHFQSIDKRIRITQTRSHYPKWQRLEVAEASKFDRLPFGTGFVYCTLLFRTIKRGSI